MQMRVVQRRWNPRRNQALWVRVRDATQSVDGGPPLTGHASGLALPTTRRPFFWQGGLAVQGRERQRFITNVDVYADESVERRGHVVEVDLGGRRSELAHLRVLLADCDSGRMGVDYEHRDPVCAEIGRATCRERV